MSKLMSHGGKVLIVGLVIQGATLLGVGTAEAQGWQRRNDRNNTAVEVGRDRGKVADDARDLARFDQTLRAFDAAMARRDAVGVRGALQSFVQQGRVEVAEQRRETAQAQAEVGRSANEARRDGTMKDRRDLRDDRRDAAKERRELVEEESLLGELERTASAEVRFGPQPRILNRAREVMVRFTQLAAAELQRSRQELREDRRELREDQRNIRRPR